MLLEGQWGKRYFCDCSSMIPVQLHSGSSSRSWDWNNSTAIGKSCVASVFGVLLHIQFDCFQTEDILLV